jgi:hypothetical protein
MNYLNSPALSRAQWVAEIAVITLEGLSNIYYRILYYITSLRSSCRKFMRTLFTWMVYIYYDLTAGKLKLILWSENFNSYNNIDHAIIMCSGGLLKK